jgi:hypothetical protein
MLPDELLAIDVLILPGKVSDGRGLYDDSAVTLAKEIRAAPTTRMYALEMIRTSDLIPTGR